MSGHSRRFRQSIRFERRHPAMGGDGMGGAADSGAWTLLAGPYHARLRPINGREEVLAGKLAGVQPYELQVRSCAATAGVITGDRAVDARTGVPYDITAIQNSDERKMYLSMLVRAGVPSDG